MKAKTHGHSTRALATAAIVLLVGLLAGCGAQPSRRATLTPIPSPFNAPIFVVVNDVTGPFDEASSSARAAAFEAVVSAAWNAGAGVVLVTAGGDAASVKTIFSGVAVADGENDTRRGQRKAAVTQAMIELFLQSDAVRSSGSADILASLREVKAELGSLGNGRYEVLVMSAGQMREPIDVAKHPEFLTAPSETARDLSKAGLLPDLSGFNVAVQDLGGGSEMQSLAYTALWWQVITEAGGQMTGCQKAFVSFPQEPMPEPQTPQVVEVPAPAQNEVAVRISDRLLFDVDESKIRGDAAPVVAQLVSILESHPGAPAKVFGFTDDTGSSSHNARLSQDRADAVVAALVAAGVPRTRLTAEGRGASEFVASNATAAGRQANRRVELVITTVE